MSDVVKGRHPDAGPDGVLVQIVDPDMVHPPSRFRFRNVHKYKFLDIEDGQEGAEAHGICQEEADHLAKVLQDALSQRRNVIVHCVAGVCRSGAVVEIGVMLGFRDIGAYRNPNLRVKTKMMRSLGWTYENE